MTEPEKISLYRLIQANHKEVTEHNSDVVQRLARLEENQHKPENCPRLDRMEKKLAEKNLTNTIKELGKVVAASILAVIGVKYS